MDVRTLTSILQNYCHEGKALDKIEIVTKNGTLSLNSISLVRDDKKETLYIKGEYDEI